MVVALLVKLDTMIITTVVSEAFLLHIIHLEIVRSTAEIQPLIGPKCANYSF